MLKSTDGGASFSPKSVGLPEDTQTLRTGDGSFLSQHRYLLG